MQIKKQTDWAIRMLLYLSQHRNAVIGKNLAAQVGISDKYLPHVIQQLRKVGWITSYSGATGGYVLSGDPEDITLLDVLEATGDYPHISCYAEEETAVSGYGTSDVLLKQYGYLQRLNRGFLDTITIADLGDADKMHAIFHMQEAICAELESTN